MDITAYGGINNVARALVKGYYGVNGIARPIVKGYVGVNGVATLFWEGEPDIGFKFPFSNESLINNRIEFIEEGN